MKRRVISSMLMATGLMLVAVLVSGAPPRVHVVEGIALAISFILPAVFVEKLSDLKRRWFLVLVCGLLGGLAWDIGAALTIAKGNAFELPLIYPGAVVASAILLAVHSVVLTVSSRRRRAVQQAVAADGAAPRR
jgi:hypothetical protein